MADARPSAPSAHPPATTGPADFDRLRQARHQLNELCKLHAASVQRFKAIDEAWYYITLGDYDPPAAANRKARHLSTSASCLSSLLFDVPGRFRAPSIQGLVDEFSRQARASPYASWNSEGAADTYCRVRTLPLVLDGASPEVVNAYRRAIAKHIDFVWRDVGLDAPRHAIAEHRLRKRAERQRSRLDPAYPANSFLTFWGCQTLDALRRLGSFKRVVDRQVDKEGIALLWSERTLGAQVALWSVRSERYDPHQLAWALATVVKFGPTETLRAPESASILKAALKAFFESQLPSGGWSRGEPLFHFPDAGNAYCYVFETLVELIRPALDVSRGQYFRELLKPYGNNLLAAWELANNTKESLGDAVAIGWCSNHHPHRSKPEAWATAAVFSYCEALRCLVGYWAGEAASTELGISSPLFNDSDAALQDLKQRGDAWTVDGGGWTVTHQLGALFVNPVLSSSYARSSIDPDEYLVDDRQARGAILFGPPGTGKTRLVRALAAAIGWDYVEVLASDFLAEGIDNVPARADAIFNQVMELSRCVVLFDEIDELLRDRAADSTDPFGRFLTTSMLPKLAQLWEQRRVIYFVNTNGIDKADLAIRRGQRFDALLFVAPPSLKKKLESIAAVIDDDAIDALRATDFNRAMNAGEATGWLPLVRFDQLPEVRAKLRRADGTRATIEDLKRVLNQVGTELMNSDWHPASGDKVKDPRKRFLRMASNQRIDTQRVRLGQIDRQVTPMGFKEWPVHAGVKGGYFQVPVGAAPPLEVHGEGWTAKGDSLLQFAVEARA